LALALDEPKENDNSFVNGEITYLIDKNLQERTGDIKVDFLEQGWRSGFTVSASKPVGGGPSACGSSCSC